VLEASELREARQRDVPGRGQRRPDPEQPVREPSAEAEAGTQGHPAADGGEVEQLATIAEDVWGAYGKVCKAWILFSAWVGTRPGETFSLTWDDLDLEQGLVSVKRCKPPYNVDVVPVAQRVREALLEMPVERTGHLFTTVRGLPIRKGSYTWYWDRVRVVFESKLEPARREELLEGQPESRCTRCATLARRMIVARAATSTTSRPCLATRRRWPARRTSISTASDRNRGCGLLDGGEVRSLEAVRNQRRGA
jgi:integrase